ncbi:Beta-glucanase [Crenothrix polyspora]|uniref:Beta-glucanase n=1 Tax=Crenothrix polyspora TaxID=360316 RepID=A0A1R4HHR7_9GAMM|nr:family 16 glycosylhydrolase [Crenothrix polyspora]SJM95749.1 Beta-glucanase [Crenothrix polyspora]
MKTTLFPLLIGASIMMATTSANADFYDEMTTNDPNASRWWAADGWSNGFPFDTCWKKTQFARNNGIATFGLVTSTSCNQSTLGAEYRTNGYYGYGTYSFSMKAPAQTSGVVMGAFLYRGPYDNNNGNPAHNEIVIEFVNGKVQFNYFHNNIGGHEYTVDIKTLGFDPRNGFHTYGFSWKSGNIQFLVDGVVKINQTQDIPSVEEGGMKIMMNHWKCLQASWCGAAPTTVNTTGFVDWVKYTSQ